MDFDGLRLSRKKLQEFCSRHEVSVEYFHSGDSYRLHPQEGQLGPGLKHITSTATCLESLRNCPEADVVSRVARFAALALEKEEWTSEGSASIYCRCRALPLVISNVESFTRVAPHVERILAQLRDKTRLAVGEADGDDLATWYPPNAFHTYWTLSILDSCKKFGADFNDFRERLDLERRRIGMLQWSWQVLGCQIALHKGGSSALDTDQLAWALAIVTRFDTPGFSPSTLRYRDLVEEGITTFFLAQDPVGTWHHHAPLFHYRNAGNAYCYIFETLTALLSNALPPEAVLLRSLLKPHAARLVALVDYAESTKFLLDDRAVGWSSGHRLNAPYAESWATAAVFSCMEAMRRLVGIWTKEEALQTLSHKRIEQKPEAASTLLAKRGSTWSTGETVGEQLLTMFVHPADMHAANRAGDPDERPIAENQVRSAILFGPPGTSKTTLARNVAAAIGWSYVELHPSHFVAGGLPNVQRTADEIFTRLMELDRCVILFDEIDELMREREKEPDAFGRFLTTSMLPKLAELWEQRRCIYFVATNHIDKFDHALTRSQRFDALVLVPPPAFDAKIAQLVSVLRVMSPETAVTVGIARHEIDAELDAIPNDGEAGELSEEQMLAKFVLMRWDQLQELAHHLLTGGPKLPALVIDAANLRRALARIADPRLRELALYRSFRRDRGRSARDFGKDVAWLVDGTLPPDLHDASFVRSNRGKYWCVGTKDLLPRTLEAYDVSFPMPGSVRVSPRA